MTMIGPQTIQADIVTDVKGTASITSLLNTADEVRESEYQGRTFGYPAIRVAIVAQVPLPGPEPCDLTRLSFVLRVYTEGGSSRSNSQILEQVNNRYHRRLFDANTWRSVFRSVGLNNPTRASEKLWRGEAMFEGIVYPKSGAI